MPASVESPYSTDANLWGRSIECGVLEDPWTEPPEDIYALTRSPAEGFIKIWGLPVETAASRAPGRGTPAGAAPAPAAAGVVGDK